MWVYSASSCEEIVSLPIFRAWIRTWRYRDRRAATPSDSCSPSPRRPSSTVAAVPEGPPVAPSTLMVGEYPSCGPESKRQPHRLVVEHQLADDLTVDLDHGDALEIGGQQRVVAVDVDLAQREPAAGAERRDRGAVRAQLPGDELQPQAAPLADRGHLVAQRAVGGDPAPEGDGWPLARVERALEPPGELCHDRRLIARRQAGALRLG